MTDIFVSYSSANYAQAQELVAELEANGFEVWWDTSLITGNRFGDEITKRIDEARAVIVIWSPESVSSDWVRWEATRANERKVLIPLRTPELAVRSIPPPFGVIQTSLLSNRVAISTALAALGLVRRTGYVGLPSTHLVILVHGINTRGLWMGNVGPALEDAGFAVGATSFGRFSLFRFLAPLPWYRHRAIARVEYDVKLAIDLYRRKVGKHPEKLSVISHSFGTYVVAAIVARNPDMKWYRVIFCGSVLREDFDLGSIMHRFEDPLLNEVGINDYWPVLAESAGWGYGSVGSTQFNRPGVFTRWHERSRHSAFLTKEFCRRFWVPFLRGESPRPEAEPAKMPPLIRIIALLPLRWLILAIFLFGVFLAGSVILQMTGEFNVYCSAVKLLTTDTFRWNCS
ncbi:TIR domain-containing protein [Bradyrhizobium algeriense]|uniref:TIR domain-containing protein n=1 Tax=Bradyrhizobium algeriense TaxID=634784 RepID=UPI000D3BE0F9|nr:TIR domain-containing protein [Bradyrhizobium algeriense]